MLRIRGCVDRIIGVESGWNAAGCRRWLWVACFALRVFEDSAILHIEASLLLCLFSTPWLLGRLCTGSCFVGDSMCLVIYSLSFMPCRRAFSFCLVILRPQFASSRCTLLVWRVGGRARCDASWHCCRGVGSIAPALEARRSLRSLGSANC